MQNMEPDTWEIAADEDENGAYGERWEGEWDEILDNENRYAQYQ